MDNVACFGSEAKLINCSYHSDTSEDDHSADVLVHCALENETTTPDSETTTVDTAGQESATTLSVVSLCVALIICVVVVVLGMVYIIHKHQKCKKHPPTTERQVKKFCIGDMSLLTFFFRAVCQTYSSSPTEDEEVTTGKSGSGPQSRYSHPHQPKQPPNDQSHSAYQPL